MIGVGEEQVGDLAQQHAPLLARGLLGQLNQVTEFRHGASVVPALLVAGAIAVRSGLFVVTGAILVLVAVLVLVMRRRTVVGGPISTVWPCVNSGIGSGVMP